MRVKDQLHGVFTPFEESVWNPYAQLLGVSSKYVILLTEDVEEDRFVFLEAVKRAGLCNPVRMVNDGREAIGYISGEFFYADRERFPFPTALMLDLKLPRTSGWEVLEWVRARREFARLLVVVLTASEYIPDLEKAYRMGANSFLTKPCRSEDLRNLATTFPEHFGPLVMMGRPQSGPGTIISRPAS